MTIKDQTRQAPRLAAVLIAAAALNPAITPAHTPAPLCDRRAYAAAAHGVAPGDRTEANPAIASSPLIPRKMRHIIGFERWDIA